MSDQTIAPSDLMVGSSALAVYLGPGWSARSVADAARKGQLPVWRLGKRYAASRAALDAWVAAQSARARAEFEARHIKTPSAA